MSNSTSVRSTFLALCAASFDSFEAEVANLGTGDRLSMERANEIAGATLLQTATVAYESCAPGLLTVVTRGRSPSIHLSMTDEQRKAIIKVQAKARSEQAKADAAAKDARIAALEAALAAKSAPPVDASSDLAVWADVGSDLATV
jgi:hypothetical protein